MKRKAKSRGERAAATRKKNKKLALKAAEQAASSAAANEALELANAKMREESTTTERIRNAFEVGKARGFELGFANGRQEGIELMRRQLQSQADNLNTRQTELGAAATVIDAMAKTVDAGAQALTSYIADKRNGPAIEAITDAVAGAEPVGENEIRLNAPGELLAALGIAPGTARRLDRNAFADLARSALGL